MATGAKQDPNGNGLNLLNDHQLEVHQNGQHPPTPVIASNTSFSPSSHASRSPFQSTSAGGGPMFNNHNEFSASDSISNWLVNHPLSYDHSKFPLASSSTSSLLSRVLQFRELQCADQLFTLPDYDIIMELHQTLPQIKSIFNDPSYTRNPNDQSVVELVLSRLTAAIRETSCIETYAPALVDLLDACLAHRMYMVGGPNGSQVLLQDSPHCKIASELLSTLFLYHSKRSVMTVAIPVAIKALATANNADLVRNTTSYLSLAAIHNGKLISQYSIQIIHNIVNGGNYSLVRVLPQIYPENREPFHAHLGQLFRLLHNPATDVSEKLSLLQLASMVANTKPMLIIPHMCEFDEFLLSGTTCTAVLHILLSLISMNQGASLTDQLRPLRLAVRHSTLTQNNLATMGKIVGVVGRSAQAEMAAVAVADLVELCRRSTPQNLPILLKEIEGIAEVYPSAVGNFLDAIRSLSEHQPGTYSAYVRIRSLALGEEIRRRSGGSVAGAVVFNGGAEAALASVESLKSRDAFPNDPTPAVVEKPRPLPMEVTSNSQASSQNMKLTKNDNSVSTLDRNMQALLESYRMRSNGSLGQQNLATRGGNGSYLSVTSNSNQISSAQNVGTDHSHVTDHSTIGPRNLRNSFISNTGMTNPVKQQVQSIGTEIGAMNPSLSASVVPEQPVPTFFADLQQQTGGNRSMHFQVPIQLGRDGRVRPISSYGGRNKSSPSTWNWMLSQTPLPASVSANDSMQRNPDSETFEETTVFPVNAGARPVRTTTPKAQSGGQLSSVGTEPPGTGRNPGLLLDYGCPEPLEMASAAVLRVGSSPDRNLGPSNNKDQQSNQSLNKQNSRAIKYRNDNIDRNDVVQQFAENRRSKIRRYVNELTVKYPIPVHCALEGPQKSSKSRLRVHFACQTRAEHCIYATMPPNFSFKTKIAPVWLHLMFLQSEVESIDATGRVLTQDSEEFRQLANVWGSLHKDVIKNRTFANLVLSTFPSFKEQLQMLKELQDNCYFDSFLYNAGLAKWSCFSCARPDKVRSLLRIDHAGVPLLEGQLKEKRGKWKFLRRWHTKYFTLSSAALTCVMDASRQQSLISKGIKQTKDSTALDKMINPSIELQKIRSVKSLTRSRRNPKLPRAFEVFTEDNKTYVLKANDRNQAEEWFQCLQIAVAQAQRERTQTIG